LSQMESVLWNKQRTEWERTALDHGEGIDCLVYLARNLRWHRDCRPVEPRDIFRGGAVAVTPQQLGLRALAGGVFRRTR
jgi:hypothetical protein